MIFAIFVVFVNEIDVFFVHFDVILNVAIEKIEQFNETNCKNIIVFIIKFFDIVKKIDDFREKNVHVTIDFSTNSLVKIQQNFENF